MQNQQSAQDQLLEFSRQAGEALVETLAFYPELFASAVLMAQSPPSPSLESQLMELRATAANIADTMAIFTRTTTTLQESYNQLGIQTSHNPQTVRRLMLEIMESCFLLSRVPSLGDLSELSILTPQELEAHQRHPQVEDWLRNNAPADMDPWQGMQASAAAATSYESTDYPQATPTSPASPYPQVEQSPYPQVEPATPMQQPIAPASPAIPVEPIPTNSPDPWDRPHARPSTEGDRSRNHPQGQ